MIKLIDWDKPGELEYPMWIERECRGREYARRLAEIHRRARRAEAIDRLKVFAAGVMFVAAALAVAMMG